MAESYDPDRLMTERPTWTPTVKVTPYKSPDGDRYTPQLGVLNEVVDRIGKKESGGRYDVLYGEGKFTPGGDHPRIAVPIKSGPNVGKTSSAAGYGQFIGSTWDKVAKQTGHHEMTPEAQRINTAFLANATYRRLTGRDLAADWSTGDPGLRAKIDNAMGAEWEAFAKPGPRVDKLPGYRFSDYAMKEHDGRPDTDVVMMSPQQYLDLSPALTAKPFQNAAGRSLMDSYKRGEPIESIPSLGVNVDGTKATVTEQDGRHRALLAQKEGLEAIPVAVRGLNGAQPEEIVGMDGKSMPHDFKKATESPDAQPAQIEQPPARSPISLISQAHADEPKRDAAGNPVDVNPYAEFGAATAPTGGGKPASGSIYEGYSPSQSGKPIAQMTQKEARDAGLTYEQQREWIEAQKPHGLTPDQWPEWAGAATRGLAPYAAGAGIGGLIAGPPGALVGAGLVLGADALTGIGNAFGSMFENPVHMATPKDVTDPLLSAIGVRKPESADARLVESTVGGAAGALAGSGVAKQVAQFGARAVPALAGTPAGTRVLQSFGDFFTSPTSKAVADLMAKNPMFQAVSGAFGGFGSQGAAELGLPPWMQQLSGFIAALAPGGVNKIGRVNASTAAKKAIDDGFVLHPSDASRGHIGEASVTELAAGQAGKTKTGQMASAVNQPRVNVKMQQELGLDPNEPTSTLYPETFDRVRARAAEAYKELYAAIPEVGLGSDRIFTTELAKVGARLKKLVEQFPHIKTLPDGVGQQIENFQADLTRGAAGDTRAVMDYLKELRRQAGHNIKRPNNAASHDLGLAQREAAQLIEDAVERSIQNAPDTMRAKLAEAVQKRDDMFRERMDLERGYGDRGSVQIQGPAWDAANAEVQLWSDRLAMANSRDQRNQTLMDRWRGARKTIAQAHDIEAVTNSASGDVSAVGIFNLFNRGRPLTGALKEVAEAAGNFRKSFQNPAAFGGVEPLSVVDVGFAASHMATAATTGSPYHAAAGLFPALRHPIRRSLMSDRYQRRMVGTPRSHGLPLSALTTPFSATKEPGTNGMSGVVGDSP